MFRFNSQATDGWVNQVMYGSTEWWMGQPGSGWVNRVKDEKKPPGAPVRPDLGRLVPASEGAEEFTIRQPPRRLTQGVALRAKRPRVLAPRHQMAAHSALDPGRGTLDEQASLPSRSHGGFAPPDESSSPGASQASPAEVRAQPRLPLQHPLADVYDCASRHSHPSRRHPGCMVSLV